MILTFAEANVHMKYGIYNLIIKYNTNFKCEVMNIYNLKFFASNATIKLGFFRNFGRAIAACPNTHLVALKMVFSRKNCSINGGK